MSYFRFRFVPAFLLSTALVAVGPPAFAQVAQPVRPAVEAQDARKVRQDFVDVVKKYPPSLGRILKLDPGLMQNDAYVAPYPALMAFLKEHPEIHRNPAFYLEPIEGNYYSNYYRSESAQIWENMMIGVSVFFVVTTILFTLAWIVRTLIDYRRWHRLSRVQAEAHAKLLDRFTANDELIAYVQSPAGAKFLQSAPISLDPGAQTLGAPFARILWSVQAGLVLGAGGLGLYFVSGRLVEEVSQPVFTMGVLALSLGVGFVMSAVVSFLLSKKLGLFEPAASFVRPDRHEPRDA